MICSVSYKNGIDELSLHELTSNKGGNIEREKGQLFCFYLDQTCDP